MSGTIWLCIIFTWSGAYHNRIFLLKYPVNPNCETMTYSIMGKLDLQGGMKGGVHRLKKRQKSRKLHMHFSQVCIAVYD
jgi:hypothetical protein